MLKQQESPETTTAEKSTVLIERKLYRLNSNVSSFMNLKLSGSYFQIEEQIEYYKDNDVLVPGTKTIIIRDKPDEDDDLSVSIPPGKDGGRRRVMHVGNELFRFSLEEEEHSIKDDGINIEEQGIGGSAWESSIVMSLFFASRPELLYKNVLELGSGIGLGGLLSTIASFTSLSSSAQEKEITSLTLTDSYEALLQHCAHNIQKMSQILQEKSINLGIDVNVQQLNWNLDVPSSLKHTYQTVIAADCAYIYPDIKPLSQSIAMLLSPQDEKGKTFIFGPYQRNVLRDLQTMLEDRYRMDVNLALMEMEVMELEPIIAAAPKDELPSYLLPITSKRINEYLLIEAEHDKMFRTDIIDGDEEFFLPENYNENYHERLDLEPEFES